MLAMKVSAGAYALPPESTSSLHGRATRVLVACRAVKIAFSIEEALAEYTFPDPFAGTICSNRLRWHSRAARELSEPSRAISFRAHVSGGRQSIEAKCRLYMVA